MSNSKFRQDLPPPGGYKPIPYIRIPAKQYFNGVTMFAGFTAITFGAIYLYSFNYRLLRKQEVEERSCRIAMQPMLYAERDRAYLRQIRKNVEEEARLMKDVPGWELGTYWGEPVYKTRPKDSWMNVTLNEYYAHVPNYQLQYSYNFYKWF